MECRIIAVGTELILGLTTDTNSPYIARILVENGISSQQHQVVPDDVDEIAHAILDGLQHSDVLIITGGLGPTFDDVTREALSKAVKRELVFDPKLAEIIKERFPHDKPMPEFILRQAYLPEGAIPISPTLGTAPGIILEIEDKTIFALPGVPDEMKVMLKDKVIPFLRKRVREKAILIKVIKTCDISEASLQERIEDIIAKYENLNIKILVHLEEVHILLMAEGDIKAVEELISNVKDEIADRLGKLVYGFDEDTLEKVVGKLLRKHELKLAVAESCTGGLLSNRFTNIPGSSDYFWAGIIPYSTEVKRELIRVPSQVLLEHGAVSSFTAQAMADGARLIVGADIGLGITGIAGPTHWEKPVGLTFIALSTKTTRFCKRFIFTGSREVIKFKTSQQALNLLRLFLLERFEEGEVS
ncbi:MAG: competence/damage-inducible protein A [Actinomycetota bacterium]|nr:competence/damage-inducible protein A [Actinomycetota bacterium]